VANDDRGKRLTKTAPVYVAIAVAVVERTAVSARKNINVAVGCDARQSLKGTGNSGQANIETHALYHIISADQPIPLPAPAFGDSLQQSRLGKRAWSFHSGAIVVRPP
jgi:hypothetical protein